VCTLPLYRSGRHRAPWLPTTYARLPQLIAVPRCRSRFWSVRSGRIFPGFCLVLRPGLTGLSTRKAASHPVCFPLAGVLTVVEGLTTLLSIASPVSPDGVPGMHEPLFLEAEQRSPTSRRVPVVTLACSLAEVASLSSELHTDLTRLLDFLPISRVPSTDFQPRGISAPHRPGDGLGYVTRRLLRSASYPCRLRATAHPDRLPSSVRNPNLLSLLRVVPRRHASFDILRKVF